MLARGCAGMSQTIFSLLSPETQSRIAQKMSGGPYETSDKLAAVACEIAGDPSKVGLTRDHVLLVPMLVALEAGIDPQAMVVLALAIDQLREAGQVSA